MDGVADLIERIEGAEGASRELDAEIALAVGYETYPDGYGEGNEWIAPDGTRLPRVRGLGASPPKFSASLDAAMSLVPEGWNWMAGERNQGRCRAYVNNGEPLSAGNGLRRNPNAIWHEVVAATPALALVAACIKARGIG